MEQSTGNAQYALDLIRQQRESGGLSTVPERSRALELIRKKKGEFNLGKLRDSAIAGTLGTIADVEQGLAIGMDRLGFQRGPGAQADDGSRSTGASPRNPLVRAGEEVDEDQVQRVVKLAKGESNLIRQSRKDTNVLRQAAAEVAPDPSDSFLGSLAENVASSTPHFAAGIAAATVGGPVAGAGYFAATEGGAHTTRVYEDLISRGVDPDRALESATNSGLVYAAASGILERVGLGKIVPTKGLGKSIAKVADSPKWRGALARVGGAAFAEGSTEVAQGIVADALVGYATDDWGEFKDRFTRSDTSLQEFLVGGVMGGGVRGAFEVVDPSNYRTFEAWKADQQAEIAKAGEVVDAEVAEVTPEESVAEGQEAPTEPRTAPVIDQSQNQEVAQSEQPAAQEDGVSRFLRANKAEGQEVDPPSERHQQLKDRFEELGINVRYVDAGERLDLPGASPTAGEIVIDANATEDRQLEALAWHEAVHDVHRRTPDAWSQLREDLGAVVPEMLERAERRYAIEWGMINDTEATPERIADEGPSVIAEHVIETIHEMSQNPEVFGEIMRKNPSLADRIIGTIQAMFRRMKFYSGLTRLEKARELIQTQKDHAQAATLIRDAVNGLRYAPVPERAAPISPPAPVEQAAQPDTSLASDGAPQDTQPVAGVEGQEQAQQETPQEPEPTPRVVLPRNKKSGEFSSRSFRKRRAEIASRHGFDPVGQIDLTEEESSLIGDDVIWTNFRGPIPQELKEALEGKPANVRMMFRGNVSGARGAEDALGVLGADEYVRRVSEFANRGETGVKDFLSDIPEYMEPELAVMDLIDDLRTMGRPSWTVYRPDGTMHKTVYNGESGAKKVLDKEVAKRFGDGGRIEHDPGIAGRPFETLDNPEDLPDGSVFKIEGMEFVAYTAEDGSKRMSSEDGHDVVLTGVPAIPIEKGSLNKNAGREAFVDETDPLDAIPFAVAPATNSHKFRKWFGDSKIVDDDGKPLVVYHGTTSEFNQFEDRSGIGHYFTEFPDEASHFAQSYRHDPRGQKMIPAYLSIKNPLDAFSDEYKAIQQRAGGGNPRGMISTEAKRRGYDGIVWNRNGDGFVQIIAFEPNQIKSATGNSGSFDQENPDIRFATSPQNDDQGIFGQRMYRDNTGSQNALFQNQEQGETQLDKEIREKADADEKRIGNDPDQGTLFATNPGGNSQENLPGVSPVNESFITQGRPDLANPGRSGDARNLIDQFDELRNQRGEPERVADRVAQDEADRIIARDAESAEQAIHDKVGRGEALDEVETAVAFKLVNRRAADALRDGSKSDYRKALEIHEAYRRSGTIWARAGRQRRDTELGPRERYQAAITNALLFPDANFKRRLEELHKIIDDPKSSKRKVKKAQEQQASLFEHESKKMRRIKKDLSKQGIDPRVLNAESMSDPVFASIVVDTARRARTTLPDALYWVWMNSILSGPLTHAANMIGNAANFAYRFGVIKGIEGGAGSLHKIAGGEPDFTLGDYAHMWGTFGKSLALGWQNAARAYATNRQVFDEQITGQFLPTNTFKGEEFFVPDAGPRNKALRAAGLGGIPLKMLMAEDQFFKTVAGVMHAHSLAHRQAVREGLKGEARDARISELLEPREGLFGQQQYDSDIWRQGLEEARVVSFQDDPSVIGRTALKFRSGEVGNVARWIIPFIRTPDRLFVRGLESSILGGLNAAIQASDKVIGDATGRRVAPEFAQSDTPIAYDAAVAISVLGMFAAIMGLRDDEDGFPRITGSMTPDWRNLPEQYRTAPPMSIRIGNKWYSYSRIEPLSTSLALTIDILDRIDEGDDIQEAFMGSLETMIALTKDKTFVRGIGEIFELFEDPERAGENAANLARRTLVTAWVPNLFKQTARAFNPEIVDNRSSKDSGFWERQGSTILYESLPVTKLAPTARYDIWGRPITRSAPSDGVVGTLWRLGVPINVSDHNLHPMDLLIYNYNQKVVRGEIDKAHDVEGADSVGEIHARPPSRYFTRGGERIDLSAEEYQEMIRNAGERASERLLSMNLNVDDPGPRDVERIKQVFSREYSKERTRIYNDRRSSR